MKIFNVLIMVLVLAIVISPAVSATDVCVKYEINGDLSDWGLDLTQDWSKNSTWVPSSTISFVIEDNNDPRYSQSYYGVHIKGRGSSYVAYEEPKIPYEDGKLYAEPSGGEKYDLEAIYFDKDDLCVYFVIINSQPPEATGFRRPGDLALDLDRNSSTGEHGYEYGVKTGDNYLNQFDVYYLPDWEVPTDFKVNKPSYFKSAESRKGGATGAYINAGIEDNGVDNYIIELAIPKSLVGNTSDPKFSDAHISEGCGNDHLEIPVPEFAFIVIPIAIIGFVIAFSFKSAKKQYH